MLKEMVSHHEDYALSATVMVALIQMTSKWRPRGAKEGGKPNCYSCYSSNNYVSWSTMLSDFVEMCLLSTSTMSDSAKVSFTIRRPSPVSRASSAGADSDFKIPALPRHLTNGSAPGSPLRRESPKPNSRTFEERDSSDEEEQTEDELVTGFDQFGVQRYVSLPPLPLNRVRNSQKCSPLAVYMKRRSPRDLL